MEGKIEEDLLKFYGTGQDEEEKNEIGIEMKDDLTAIMDRISDYDVKPSEFVEIVNRIINKLIK